MTDRDLLLKIIDGQGRQDERLKNLHDHMVDTKGEVDDIREDVGKLQDWKNKWGGAALTLGGLGTLSGILVGVGKVYAMWNGG